ncbi:MAG TPA: LLM class flavin-dependent oxidoreductase [Candidatus Dormibacteraeota bacterium]
MKPKLGCSVEAGRSLPEAVERARAAERLGYDSIWSSQLPGSRDTALVLAAYAQATERVRLGTAVLPIYTRHPTAMAQMAMTLDELSGGRFILGLGVSHQVTVESMWGLRLENPVVAMREYLTILRASFREGAADQAGRHFSAHWGYTAPRNGELPIYIAALGEHMLQLAGELADGVSLWMCPPGYVREVVVPQVRAGRERAGKPLEGFDIMAVVPVSLAAEPQKARDAFRETVKRYAGLPFYRKVLDSSGFAEELARDQVSERAVDELAGIGDAAAVQGAIARYREAGVTLPVAGPTGSFDATIQAAAGA